uniref:Uncharacterized protein n=1 Tax=Anguilla anguilla TaxID=7936 RepID=A0A0E9RGM5_ANGAN
MDFSVDRFMQDIRVHSFNLAIPYFSIKVLHHDHTQNLGSTTLQ